MRGDSQSSSPCSTQGTQDTTPDAKVPGREEQSTQTLHSLDVTARGTPRMPSWALLCPPATVLGCDRAHQATASSGREGNQL